MIQQTLKAPSLGALLTLIETFPAHERYLFGGQGNAAWKLVPNLYRITPNLHAASVEETYNIFEAELVDRFFAEGAPYLPTLNRSYSNDRALAQHFGVPTRLLDWSEDPLIATYFAVEAWDKPNDAALYVVLPGARFLPEHVRDFKSHAVVAFRPPAIDRRIPAQRSVFTFHPHTPSDEAFVPLDNRPNVGSMIGNPHGQGGTARGFGKIIIPQALKGELFRRLLHVGIDRRNLFPGLDGIGADIALRARCGQWSR